MKTIVVCPSTTSKVLFGASLICLSALMVACASQKEGPRSLSPVPAYEVAAHDEASLAQGGPEGMSAGRSSEKKKSEWAPQASVSHDVEGDAREEPKDGGWNLAPAPEMNTEAYDSITENRFVSATHAPLSTFSVDVDTASYSNVRRFLASGSRPPAGAVRIEELVNYFDYDYEAPSGDAPFSVHTELSTAPWAPEHRLLHIGLQGKRIAVEEVPSRNLVFLLDVSGSMEDENKLPLLKRSLRVLLETLNGRDTVSIVVYAGASGMVLPPTKATDRGRILEAFERLQAGGSTNGGEGIELAYELAERSFQAGGVNRVILATDGDFNVGTTSQSELTRLIEKKRDSGVFLTVLGFGMGNYKDSTLENLADKGNGNYAYIDSFSEARKVLVEEGGANLVTIAKDVKIQVEMNPETVGAYRLIGYENRALRAEDFNDDQKDAGEIGAGHTVTALYEILTPAQAARELSVDDLRYSRPSKETNGARLDDARSDERFSGELAMVKLRYKEPEGSRSRLLSVAVKDRVRSPGQTSDAYRFSAAVAGFGMLLRSSQYAGQTSFRMVEQLAKGAQGEDPFGHKREFLKLVNDAAQL